MPKIESFTLSQKRAVAVAVVVALLFGAYFLRNYFILIMVAAIAAYLFLPLYRKLNKKISSGGSAAITLFAAILLVLLPLAGVIALSVAQITGLIDNASDWMNQTDMSKLGEQSLQFVNDVLAKIPYVDYTLTESDISDWAGSAAQTVGHWFVGVASGLVGSLFGLITTSIIFIYTFISMLVNHQKLKRLFEQLNPLGEDVSRMYLRKAGAMIHGAVGGQFIIAVIQGFTGALSVYIAGFHEAFFALALLFTVLSMIPLGSGIITIPIGVVMMLFGNIPGGLLVILWHILGASNIDNILRPILVPRTARLDPALMLLTVFAGIAMFGFWGLFIGPVIMILIVTTIRVYLAVYKGVPLDEPEPPKKKPSRLKKLFKLVQKKSKKA